MELSNTKKIVEELLSYAKVNINGNNPSDIKVNNEKLYTRLLSEGSLALGESYMDGWWDAESIDQLITKLLNAELDKKIHKSKAIILNGIKARLFNLQSLKRSKIVGEKHYDIGNELYKLMLDKEMIYSCGYWKNANDLDEAQIAKLDLICKKIKLKPGDKILDIGCGWGGMAKFAAKNYGAKVLGITISKEQAKLAKENCKGLDVEIKLQDYRLLDEKFDKIISVGMFEHVGFKNYRTFFESCHRLLKPNGISLLHTIGGNTSQKNTDPWIEKYIFANGMLPSPVQITKAIEGLFKIEDWHNFGPDYDKTLMAWHKNFNDNWHLLKDKYDNRFKRMWNYYLLSCAGSFRSRKNQLWQIVITKNESDQNYISIR